MITEEQFVVKETRCVYVVDKLADIWKKSIKHRWIFWGIVALKEENFP